MGVSLRAAAGAVALGLVVVFLGGCASAGPSPQAGAAEEALDVTAAAVVRNANAIAAGSPVTQEDLDQSVRELAESGFDTLGYSFGELGSGDAPAVTISWSEEGVSCTARIAKADPSAAEVSVVTPASCS